MKYLFLMILFTTNVYAKKFAIVIDNKIVYKYESENKQVFGGEWGSEKASHLEVAEEIDLKYLEINESGNFYQRQKTQDELDQSLEQAIAKKIACGEATIKFIAKNNVKKQLTVEQRRTMVQTYSGILDLLKSGSVDIAKVDIQNVTADGTIVTEQDKTDIVAFITACE